MSSVNLSFLFLLFLMSKVKKQNYYMSAGSKTNLFQKMGGVLLFLSIARSILAMKILANAKAIFVPIVN